MAKPPRDVIDQLVPEWNSAARHEAGHAVVFSLLGIEVDSVHLYYEKKGFWNPYWTVLGYNSVDDSVDDDPASAIVGVAAGAAAQGLWHHRVDGVSCRRGLKNAQRWATQDAKAMCEYSRKCGISVDKAFKQAEKLVRANWGAIDALAEELTRCKDLSGGALKRLLA